MSDQGRIQQEVIYIKNMVSRSCVILLREKLESIGVKVTEIKLGYVNITYNTRTIKQELIIKTIERYGFGIILGREKLLVEQIKHAVIDLVHYMNNIDSIARKSDYLVERLGMSYQQISKLFSKHESITLERYIILNKIERIKGLIDGGEFTLSEIAYMMDYSSVQHLSNQFKKITGLTVSEYKASDKTAKKPLDELY